MSDQIQSTAALANLLESRLQEWERARKPQEVKMIDCYQDVMRIPRDDDTRGTGAARTKKSSGIFIGSTRNKVRAARAKIVDALFGNGLMPFDTTPTNEELAPFSDCVEDIVTEQLERMSAKAMLKSGVDTLANYGTGFIFGPFVRKECLIEASVDNSLGVSQLKESKYEFDFPYFDLANTLDVYPDPEARDVTKGLGVFWVTKESPHTVAAWRSDKSYKNIAEALVNTSSSANETGSEIAGQRRGNVEFWRQNGRIKVARFFGKVPLSALREPDATAEQIDTGEMVDVVVIMAGGVVVKINESPYGDKSPSMPCQYEEVAHEVWGVGVAENNSPHQKVTNAAFRLFMEGKAMALLGTKSVDRSMFSPLENFKKYPGKVYQMKPGLSPDERKTAIIEHIEADITGGWMDVMRVSEQMSDDDTGITKYTQGDDSSNLNKTASGISMIMSASSLPIKEVIQHIDEGWIEPIVERLIAWNLKYLEVETVRKIHGDKMADIWRQIKEFGKSSFMDFQATGTSSFMAKEVLANKLRAYLELCVSNPALAAKVDITELLQQYWDVMGIGKESPVLKDEGGKIPPHVKQQMEQMQQHAQMLEDSLKEVGDKFNELHAKSEAEREERQLRAYDSTTRRLQVLAPFLTPQMAMQLAQNIGLDIANDADLSAAGEQRVEEVEQPEQMPDSPESAPEPEMMAPEPGPDMLEPPPEEMPPEQPADAGFFTPEPEQQ